MIVFYFGADEPWQNQNPKIINRRNLAVLSALANSPKISKVYNVIRCTKSRMLTKNKQIKSANPKIDNLYVASILPERGKLAGITKKINQFILKYFFLNGLLKEESISWCYWPKGFQDYRFLGLRNRMIFDTDHNIIDDPNISNRDKKERKKLLLDAGKEAFKILSSSRSMLNWYKEEGFNEFHLMLNGVFVDRVNLSAHKLNENYTVTYCGTLSKWIKSDWFFKLVKENPDWTFNIIGKNYKTDLYERLSTFENVKLLGFLQPFEVDKYISSSHVCFGLYQEHKALDVNSMKLYDYLSQGKPVVVNDYHNNLKNDFKEFVQVTSEFDTFQSAMEQPKFPKTTELMQFLKESSWQNRVNPIIDDLIYG